MKAAFALTILASLSTIHAAVIQNDAIIGYANGTGGLYYPTRTFTLISGFILVEVINSAPNEFKFEYQPISAYNKLLMLPIGTDFTAQIVNSNSPTFSLTLLPRQSTYLAYWTKYWRPYTTGAAEDGDTFGWAKVSNFGGSLVVSSSATADSGGIIVGTLQQIPEVGTISLLAAGAAFSFVQRSRTKRGRAAAL